MIDGLFLGEEAMTTFREFEHAGWADNSTAQSYHQHVGQVTVGCIPDLLDAAGFKRGDKILDVACGAGYVAAAVRDRGAEAVGVDFSTSQVRLAQQTYPGIRFAEGDAEALPFQDGEFAAVLNAFGLPHIPDAEKAAAEARRVLKPGGLLVFNVWDRFEANPTAVANATVIEGMFPGDPQVRFRVPFEMHDPALLRRMLDDARFRERRIEPKEVAIEAASAREVAIGQVRGTPRSALLEKKGASLDDVIDRVAAELARIGGAAPYRASSRAIVVEAVARP